MPSHSQHISDLQQLQQSPEHPSFPRAFQAKSLVFTGARGRGEEVVFQAAKNAKNHAVEVVACSWPMFAQARTRFATEALLPDSPRP